MVDACGVLKDRQEKERKGAKKDFSLSPFLLSILGQAAVGPAMHRVRRQTMTDGGAVNDLRIQLRTALVLVLSVAAFHNVDGQEVIRSTYTYKTIGNLRIRADVYRRPGEIVTPAETRPAPR